MFPFSEFKMNLKFKKMVIMGQCMYLILYVT